MKPQGEREQSMQQEFIVQCSLNGESKRRAGKGTDVTFQSLFPRSNRKSQNSYRGGLPHENSAVWGTHLSKSIYRIMVPIQDSMAPLGHLRMCGNNLGCCTNCRC